MRTSKSKYEARFKKWGFRKNLKKHEWIPLDYHITKRKRESKKSNVYFHRRLMPQETVRKETLRNRLAPTLAQHAPSSAPSPELPSGLVVCTPAGAELAWPRTANLPWLKFASVFERSGIVDSKTYLDVQKLTAYSKYGAGVRYHPSIRLFWTRNNLYKPRCDSRCHSWSPNAFSSA